MFAVRVEFRDENGEPQCGELVNPFRIMVEGVQQVVHVAHESPAEVAVMTFDGETLDMHCVPTLAIIRMNEVAFQ